MEFSKLVEVFKNKNNVLKHYLIEKETVNKIRNELEIQIARLESSNDILKNENNEFYNKINKIKQSKRTIKICTGIFYLSLIISCYLEFINFLNHNFGVILATIPLMTGAYIVSIASDIKFLKNNKIKFFSDKVKENNQTIKLNNEKMINLHNELKDVIKREFNCRKLLEQYTFDFEKMLKLDDVLVNNEENDNKFMKIKK